MNNLLITGATGNIGFSLIKFLSKTNNNIIVGARNIDKAKSIFNKFPIYNFVNFDFENSNTYETALSDIDRIFLLRPPHISNIEKYFKPLIKAIQTKNIKEIVFLSVQGAEKSSIIPHNKIEKLIYESGFDYIILRPSYFMQNLTTTLIEDIKLKREIILPASNAKFNWVDIDNIAEVGAILLNDFNSYKNKAFEITGLENKNFETVVSLINNTIENPIKYRNVNPFKFYKIKKRDGMKSGMIIVMIFLHFLPKFQKEPKISNLYKELTGKNPTDLESFIERARVLFE